MNTPILFLIFNRLDTTTQVFNEIKKIKPKRFYIACDGARTHKEGEKDKVQKVRDFVLTNIDWDCEVRTLFRDNNLGCKEAVSSAITWFFENEEMGIILEDDCLPSQSFFLFCEELLLKYKEDTRIWLISGTNQLYEKKSGVNESYSFSKYDHIWGWASWRRAWSSYDKKILSYPLMKEQNMLKDIFPNKKEYDIYIDIYDRVYEGLIDTWDYQWRYCLLINDAKSIIPNINMISNIGFGEDATHSKKIRPEANRKRGDLSFPLVHPVYIANNIEDDNKKRNKLIKEYSYIGIISNIIREVGFWGFIKKALRKIFRFI